MADTTGEGAAFYFDVDSDSQYRLAGCIYNLKPPGKARAEFTEEPCLADTVLTKGAGPLEYTNISFQLDVDVNGSVYADLHTAMDADTACLAAVKLNYATPEYMLFTMELTNLDFVEFSRENRIRYQVEGICTTNPNASISTTAPTLEA